jgi:hypothetical protein
VKAVLPQLQQLRQMTLVVRDSNSHEYCDDLLESLSALTNLTSLVLDQLWSLR